MTEVSAEGLEEHTIDSECVFRGVLLDVRRDRVRLPDGAEAVREYVRHPGAVVIIAIDSDGAIVFERQFRYPVGRAFLELPAGKLEAGEDIQVCAQRELREETGFEAGTWTHLGVIHPCIGYSDERIEVFLARDLNQVGRSLDEEEFLEVLSIPRAEVDRSVSAGRITDAKTLSALFLALPHLR